MPTSLYCVWTYRLSTATVYCTSVTKTHKLMNKDLKWWNTLRRCINKIVHAAYSKTTEATILFSENTTMNAIYYVMLKILIFHNWKRKVQFSNKMVQHSPFSNSVQYVLNGVTAVLCYTIHEKVNCGPEISKHDIMACFKTIMPQHQKLCHRYLNVCQVPRDKLFPQ